MGTQQLWERVEEKLGLPGACPLGFLSGGASEAGLADGA